MKFISHFKNTPVKNSNVQPSKSRAIPIPASLNTDHIGKYLFHRLNLIKVKALLFLAGLLLFSCSTSKNIDKDNVIVYGCIVAKSENVTMKGFKYYIIINNSLDSFYSSSRDFKPGECYPFHVKR